MCGFVMKRDFPLPRIHTGAVLGNSYLGVMVWGSGNTLNISFGCSALWDHRGGMTWTEKVSYKAIRECLNNSDLPAMRELFKADTETQPGQPRRPSLIPLGRIVLTLKESCTLSRYELPLADGGLTVFYDCEGREKSMELRLDMTEKGRFAFNCADAESFTVADSWSLGNGELARISIQPPERLTSAGGCGFANALPVDEAFGLFCRRDGELFSVKFARNMDLEKLKKTLLETEKVDYAALSAENISWWSSFWKKTPALGIDNENLRELYWYGMYKFAAMTDISGWPAGLQGPWLEDFSCPPWSGDYHFNINIEMCYWPAYRGNLPDNLKPVFKMLTDWLPYLRKIARYFIGIDDGIMLPLAMDDRGTCMGGFWTGAIDHACTAWMGQMLYDYCDYYSDKQYLKDVVFDFMKGVMRVFEEMIEEKPDGTLELPVSVSPEYRAAEMNAWGKNSSFQLAAVHRLAENLISAAAWLGEECNPFWQKVLDKLPKASIWFKGTPKDDPSYAWLAGGAEIGLWDGLELEESHRHHSHLAGICPFDVIDLEAPEWQTVLDNTRKRWIDRGMGQWSGWSMPWAAMLHCRLHNGESAELMLEIFKNVYTNEGGNSLHDTNYKGFSMMGEWPRGEVMQMDAAMGAVAAIQDMFVQSRRGVLYVGAGIPVRWKNSFVDKMPAPGGFRVSGQFNRGKCSRLEITATRENILRLHLPEPEKAWQIPASAIIGADGKLSVSLKAGETLILKS